MKFNQLVTDDDAVSPVIGVILMVAITVILAAVIAAFVFGLADTDEIAPQVTFNYNYDDGADELRIAHAGGDAFSADRVTFRGVNIGDNDRATWDERSTAGPDSRIGAGSRATLGGDQGGDPVESDFELEIVWTPSGGENSAVLSTRTGPDA